MKKTIMILIELIICVSLFSYDNTDRGDKKMTRDEFTEKLSIDGVIKTTVYNLSTIKNFEDTVLKYSKEEQLGRISGTNAAYFLGKLHLNITDESANIEQMYAFDVFDEEYSKSVWAAYGKSINQEYIIDKAENYDEFNRLSIGDTTYYSFRLKKSETGELYAPLFFYVDYSCVIITGYEDILKKILTNSVTRSYWAKENKNLFHSVNIVDFSLYREHGEGLIQGVDVENSFKYIKSLKYSFTKSITGKVLLDIQFSGENSEHAVKIKEELEKLHLEIIESISRVKNEDMTKFSKSIKISSKNSTIMVNVIIPKSILDILRFNLINSFTDLLDVFPDILYDFGESEAREVNDVLSKDLIEYKEKYEYRRDFIELPSASTYNSARLETRVEISEIGYLEDGKNLYITVKLTPMANKELSWQYKYLDFGIKHVSSNTGYIEFSEEFGVDRLPSSKTVGENGVIEQTIVFPQGIKHSDIREITTLFTFLEPKELKKITINKDDVKKTIELGSGHFTLLNLDKSFTYNFSDTRDSLIEVRPLNSKGEALDSMGGSSSWIKFPNGLKSSRLSPLIEGNTESIDIYYVSKFNSSKIDMPHAVAANFSDIQAKKDSNREPFKVMDYNPADNKTPLPIDDFFESNIENWPMANAGPFNLYLRGISDMFELELNLYIKSPDHPAYKDSLSGFELIIDEITTKRGDVISRPDAATLKLWESENNTFNKDFNWTLTGPFYNRGDSTVLRSNLVVGISSKYRGLKTLTGHIVFTIPVSVTTLNIKNLLVGDIIEDPNLELKVIKYEAGKYHLKITKGQKNLVQIRAKDPDNNKYKVLVSNINGDILTVDAVSIHEEYELTVSTKNNSYEYSFNITP